MSFKAEPFLTRVIKPYQYIGEEYAACEKEFSAADVTMLLAFPDKYEIGISNLGTRILYSVINKENDLYADRAYAPEPDFLREAESNNVPLYGVESKKPYKEFNFIGFSLQYELCYPTVLRMLKTSGIGISNSERNESDPIITAGGPCCYNPAPMSDFIDLFLIGDGEDAVVEMMNKYAKIKNLPRVEKIKELSKIPGVYSPLLNNPTTKRIAVPSEDNLPLTNPVPYSSSVHDRTIIEIRKGCGRMCRFCQPGYVNLPIRERKAGEILDAVCKSTLLTGYDEYSLLSLSSNDYTNTEAIINELNKRLSDRKVSVSLPSQRIDRYNANLAKAVSGIRKSTITLAPEAGSQRLRDVINKNLTEEQIVNTILECYSSGAESIKLYFIIGLPTETLADIEETAELLKKIQYRAREIKREKDLKNLLRLTCTVSIFVPKPFTPFQRHSQVGYAEIKERIKYLLSLTEHIKNLKINYHNPFISRLEAVFSRGDKNTGEFIRSLVEKGAYLTSWDENIDYELWEQTAEEVGISFDEEASKQLNGILPWEIISTGVDKDFLEQEYEKALSGKTTKPCEFGCVNCGVCKNTNSKKIIDTPYNSTYIEKASPESKKTKYGYRLKLTKENNLKYLSHLDWQNTVIKTLYRSGLNLAFSQGYNPTPDISLGTAMPIFQESITEFVDIHIFDEIGNDELKEIMQKVLPENIRILNVRELEPGEKSIDRLAQWAEYEFIPQEKDVYDLKTLLYSINTELSSGEEIFIEKKNKKGIKRIINIKSSIKSFELSESGIRAILKTGQNEEIPSLRADDTIKKFLPEIKFKIKRTRFFDESFNEISV